MSNKLSERVRNAIAGEGPRTNNAATLADKVAALEDDLRILQGSHDTWVRQYKVAQEYIEKLEIRIGFAAQAIPVSRLTRADE